VSPANAGHEVPEQAHVQPAQNEVIHLDPLDTSIRSCPELATNPTGDQAGHHEDDHFTLLFGDSTHEPDNEVNNPTTSFEEPSIFQESSHHGSLHTEVCLMNQVR